METLRAGASAVDISPTDAQFLFGYPHVARYSTGIHDPLFSSALYLADGQTQAIVVANDVIFVSGELARRARARLAQQTGIPASHIMITATHTHSGPHTVDHLSNADDAAVPRADPGYQRLLEDGIVTAGLQAWRSAVPVQIGLAVATVSGIGGNRRNPDGPADPQVPVLLVRSAEGLVGCMLVYSMHPTVLHEDSTLVSADFPGMARQYLQEEVFKGQVPVLYHTGPAGNQSVRHVARANTFTEARRLGEKLGRAVKKAIANVDYLPAASLAVTQAFLDLPARSFPTVEQAQRQLTAAAGKLRSLRAQHTDKALIRRAEVDWFGAEETLTLAKAAQDGRLEAAIRACLPAEVQVLRIGPWSFVAWPGEIFVEYALAIKAQCPNAFAISLANGELQGYIATEEANQDGGYEAANALFAPVGGQLLVDTSLALLETMGAAPCRCC
jgi:neutral ceramidase